MKIKLPSRLGERSDAIQKKKLDCHTFHYVQSSQRRKFLTCIQFILMFCLSFYAHSVVITSKTDLKNIVINNKDIGFMSANGFKHIDLSYGFGPVYYEAYDSNNKKITGIIKRDAFEHIILWQSIIYSVFTIPVMALSGAYAANPQWRAAGDYYKNKDSNSYYAYLNQSMSSITIPITAIGALIGSFPLLGLFFAEKPSNSTYYLD